ncbi:MAG: carbohydrate porin [Candidatus Omnitrophota bacterium]
MRLGRIFGVMLVLIFVSSNICFAEKDSLEERIKNLEARIEALEKKTCDQDKYIEEQKTCIAAQNQKISVYESKIAEIDTQLHRQVGVPAFERAGFRIGADTTMVVQGTNNANAATEKKNDKTDASYSADITVQKEFENLNSRAFIHLEAGQGNGLENDLSVFSNVNRDADNDNNVRVSEAWYEQSFLNGNAEIVFGKLDPTAYFDNNAAANDETTQFLGWIFRNSPVIEFPDNTAGFRTAIMPKDWLELSYGLFDGNSDWEKMFDNLFNIGQINFKTKFFNFLGNYRFLGWNNNSYHTKWLAPEKDKESNYGFGLSFDQKASEIITLFARYGWQNPKVYNPDITATGDLNYSLEYSWSAGLQLEGKPWGREKDILAFALGQDIPSDDYKKANTSLNARKEGHIEAYYNIHINDYLSLSPDFQYIWNPFGRDISDDTNGIFIGGLRTQVDF